MSRTLTIQVTQEDINKGERYLTHSCPVALAAKRKLKKEVSVCSHHLLVRNKHKWYRYTGVNEEENRAFERFVSWFDLNILGSNLAYPRFFTFKRVGPHGGLDYSGKK